MNLLRIAAILFFSYPRSPLPASFKKKIPIAVSHEGDDQVGQAVARALEKLIRNSPDFLLVAANAATPRIIILDRALMLCDLPYKAKPAPWPLALALTSRIGCEYALFSRLVVNSV